MRLRGPGIGLAGLLAAAALASSAGAAPGRVSVGLLPETDTAAVALAAETLTGGRVSPGLGRIGALVLAVPDVDSALAGLAGLPGVAYVEPVTASRSLAFVPTDPLAEGQWYLDRIRAFDYWAGVSSPPTLPPVRVAVIDSGIDGDHPEFLDRIEAAKSFVTTPAREDTIGHGTIVAGQIAAALDNAEGIAGLGFPVELLVAKVVRENGSISTEAVARAIRWAVKKDAQVINLSLGGSRNPNRPAFDTYSELEHSAVDYATRKGVVVVAAGGNCATYRCPEQYANYPAALPHVVGVGATKKGDGVARFSNRDDLHIDVAAPGVDMLSTYPTALSIPTCEHEGYTRCALDSSWHEPRGTSFAAPLVAATAALLFSEGTVFRPHASQVTWLVTRSARDLGPAGRDRLSGWGLLDVARSLTRLGSALPARDRLEPNDGTGARARTIYGQKRVIDATLTRYDDPLDVYRIRLGDRQRLKLKLKGPALATTRLALWRPGTPAIGASRKWRAAASTRSGEKRKLSFRAPDRGWYYAAVSGRGGAYQLVVAKT